MKEYFTSTEAIESELAMGLKGGNAGDFEEIYHLYSKRVYGVARSFYLDHADAEEMVQEVFYKLWTNRANIKPTLSIQAYLITITKNTVLKFLRSRSVRQNYLQEVMNDPPNSENEVEQKIEFQELRSRLNELLELLSPQRRKVFTMIRFEGLKAEEVAKQLKLSKRTVEHHLFHANKFIRSRLSIELLVAIYFWGLL